MLLQLRKQLFRGIDCERSCYLFTKENWLRKLCYRTIHHSRFETVVMFLIVGSSFKLVFDTYTQHIQAGDPIIFYSQVFDLFF